MTRLIALPPCGRGRGACAAVVEADRLRCVRCDCIAPLPPNFNTGPAARRSPRPMDPDQAPTKGNEMSDDFEKQAAELVLDVAAKSPSAGGAQ
jgi:hypothetical protein